MEITIENKKLQKKTSVHVQDDFITDAEDLVVNIGLDTYKLTSTKTKEEILREKLSLEFGEEVFSQLFEVLPSFGTEEESKKEEAVKTVSNLIKLKLERNPKYKPLLEDKQPDVLLRCLVTAFQNYCTVRRTMDAKDKEIKESSLHENVFYDYILRFKNLFGTAKTLKEIYDGIAKLHDFANLDKREIYGYTLIYACIRPFFNWMWELDKEFREMKPYKPLQEQSIYTDETYLTDKSTVLRDCAKNLQDLKDKYEQFETSTKVEGAESPFTLYLDKLITAFMEWTTLKEQLDEECRKKSDNQLCDIDGKAKEWNDCYRRMLLTLTEIKIKKELDHRPWKNDSEKNVIESNMAIIDYWNREVNKVKENSERAKIVEQMYRSIKTNTNVLKKLKSGELDAEALLNGKYTPEELNKD